MDGRGRARAGGRAHIRGAFSEKLCQCVSKKIRPYHYYTILNNNNIDRGLPMIMGFCLTQKVAQRWHRARLCVPRRGCGMGGKAKAAEACRPGGFLKRLQAKQAWRHRGVPVPLCRCFWPHLTSASERLADLIIMMDRRAVTGAGNGAGI